MLCGLWALTHQQLTRCRRLDRDLAGLWAGSSLIYFTAALVRRRICLKVMPTLRSSYFFYSISMILIQVVKFQKLVNQLLFFSAIFPTNFF